MKNVRGEAASHHSLLIIFTLFWGANFILAEVALLEMAPISFSVSRFVMGGIAMMGMLYWQCYRDAKISGNDFKFFPAVERRDWRRLLLASVLGATLAPWFGIEGLNLAHGSRASIWLALGPAISAGCGYLFSNEKMGAYGYAGIGLAGVGTLILAFDGLRPDQGYWAGDLLLIVALVMAVVELHLIKPLAHKYGSISIVAIRTAIGGGLYLLIASPALARESWLLLGFWTWFAILAGGAIGVGVGQWVKVRSLRLLGPTRVVIYGNLVPIAAIIIAWITIGEDPSIYELAAAGMIIAGAISIQVVDVLTRQKITRLEDDELSVVASGKQD